MDDTRFDQAVQLAAGFVANGDIRLSPEDPGAHLRQLEGLIRELYDLLAEIRR